jgi:hypothetical protein
MASTSGTAIWWKSLALPFYHPTFEEGLKPALRQICQAVHAPELEHLDDVASPGPDRRIQCPAMPDPKDEYALLRWTEAVEMRAKLRRVREAYRRAGLLWVLLTDVELAKAASASVVNELIANFGRPIAEDDLGRLHAELSHSGSLPLGKCEELIREGNFPRGELLSRVPENLISIDLRQPISVDTVVHI